MTDAPDIAPIHPGEVLHVEYLEPLGATQHRLAGTLDQIRPLVAG